MAFVLRLKLPDQTFIVLCRLLFDFISGNSVTVPYPPTARGNLDIVLYEYRSGSWEPADRRVNVPPSSFPVEFTDLPDGNYGVTVQGTGDGIFYGSSMSSFGQSRKYRSGVLNQQGIRLSMQQRKTSTYEKSR